MRPDLLPPPKLTPGDRVAVLSPSFAAPAVSFLPAFTTGIRGSIFIPFRRRISSDCVL